MNSRYLRCLMVAVVISVPAGTAVAQNSQAQIGCFEIVPARTDAHPTAAILLNSCSGQTWILVRAYPSSARGNPTYRWSAIASDTPEPKPPTGPPVATSSDKCFIFQGRRFCE